MAHIIRFRAEPLTKLLLDRLREEQAVNISAWMRQVIQRELELKFPDFADYAASRDPRTPGLDRATESPESHAREAHAETPKDPRTPGLDRATESPESHAREAHAETPKDPRTPGLDRATESPESHAREAHAETPKDPRTPGLDRATESPESHAREAHAETPKDPRTPGLDRATESPESHAREAHAETPEDPRTPGLDRATESPESHAREAHAETPEDPIEGWKPRKLNSGDWAAVLEGVSVAALPDDDELRGMAIVVTDKRGESWQTTIVEVIERNDDAIVVKNSGRPRS